ncbi:MAG: hypothetical protein ACOYO1_15690 [Bacteroidales bacterium]
MSENEALIKVKKWIEEGCDYTDGCSLYAIFGKNKVLSRLFPGRENTYKTKLKYELCKSVGLVEELPYNKPEAVIIGEVVEKETYPDDVVKIISEYSKLTADRAKIHSRMSALPENNNSDTVAVRKELSDEIEKLSQRIEVLHAAKEAYFVNKIFPEVNILYPEILAENATNTAEKLVLPDSPEKLKDFKKNLQTSLCKDCNLLEYQSETKQDAVNSMPDGSKRLKIEKRISNKKQIIEAIDLKLVEIAD